MILDRRVADADNKECCVGIVWFSDWQQTKETICQKTNTSLNETLFSDEGIKTETFNVDKSDLADRTELVGNQGNRILSN